jgi:pyruvate formate lyase activating enzyme
MPLDRSGRIIGDAVAPAAVVAGARKGNCATIAYTYTEPTIFFEYAYETAKLAHANGIRNVFVTNGYMTREALEMLHPYLDAANVDLKAYTDRFYKERCSARLAPVKDTLQNMKSMGVFIEVTTLIIPGLNDDPSELRSLAGFLVSALGPETPWHISRFHPTYKLTDRPPTPPQTLVRAREMGLEAGLRYVYTGNMPGDAGESTYCYACGEMLIERWGFSIRNNRIRAGRCPDCGTAIDGVGL